MTTPNTPEEAIYRVADVLRDIAKKVEAGPRRGTAPITRDDLHDILLQIAEELERFELAR